MKKLILVITMITLLFSGCDQIMEILENLQSDYRGSNILPTRENFFPGDFLISSNGKYEFKLHEDSNMTLTALSSNKLLWDSGTTGQNAFKLRITQKGDMRLYRKGGKVLWRTPTVDSGKDNYLKVNDNGSLVLYTDKGENVWEVGGDTTQATPKIEVNNVDNYYKTGGDVSIDFDLRKGLILGDVVQLIVTSESKIEDVPGWVFLKSEAYQGAYISVFYQIVFDIYNDETYNIGPVNTLLVTLVYFRGVVK